MFCSLMTLIQITQTVLTYLQRSQLVLGNPSLCVIFEYLTAASLFFGCIHWCPSVLSQRYKILERFQQVSVFTGVLRERLMVTADYDAEKGGEACVRASATHCVAVFGALYTCTTASIMFWKQSIFREMSQNGAWRNRKKKASFLIERKSRCYFH